MATLKQKQQKLQSDLTALQLQKNQVEKDKASTEAQLVALKKDEEDLRARNIELGDKEFLTRQENAQLKSANKQKTQEVATLNSIIQTAKAQSDKLKAAIAKGFAGFKAMVKKPLANEEALLDEVHNIHTQLGPIP